MLRAGSTHEGGHLDPRAAHSEIRGAGAIPDAYSTAPMGSWKSTCASSLRAQRKKRRETVDQLKSKGAKLEGTGTMRDILL